MIIQSMMDFFEPYLFNLSRSKKGGDLMFLSKKSSKSLKSVDEVIQRIKNDCIVNSVFNGVDLFKAL